jgi:hypothetical protein
MTKQHGENGVAKRNLPKKIVITEINLKRLERIIQYAAESNEHQKTTLSD